MGRPDVTSDAATLARQLGFARALGIADAMQAIRSAAAVFNGGGGLLCLNSLAEAHVGALFDVAHGSLVFYDRASQSRFDALLGSALGGAHSADPKPIAQSVRNRERGSVVIRAIGLLGWAQYPFANAKVLMLFGDPEPPGEDLSRLLISSLGLTGAEARIAIEIASGSSLAQAAEKLGIGYETARSQLRAVFAKTDTHRQSQVATLITRLSRR